MSRTGRPSSPPPSPAPWRHGARAWRASGVLTRSRLDLLLRVRSAARLPVGRGRLRAMGLPEEAIETALRQVRSVADWDAAWTWAAQRFLAEARRHEAEDDLPASAVARRRAALAYHVAQFFAFGEPKKARALRSSATTLFAQALPIVMPSVERVDLPWRAATLPGFLARPPEGRRPAPLVVVLNGTSTAKEETILWADPFLRRGLAVLALDWPGTGETADDMTLTADCDDLTDGVVATARNDPGLDAERIALVGFSLGGSLAVRAAAFDRRIGAAVVVTPAYDPPSWLAGANPVLVEQVAAAAGGADRLPDLARGFSLADLGGRLRTPLLIFGAGRDLVVPAAESLRLAAAAGEIGTLVWHPEGGHGLYEAIEEWTEDAARWLVEVLDHRPFERSTPVDTAAAEPTLKTPALA